jgi:hypothetical protein
MVEFTTIKAEEIKFGKNNFIEISRRKAVSESAENEFIAVSRGYYLPDGTKRWKSSVVLPNEKDKRQAIAKFITSL